MDALTRRIDIAHFKPETFTKAQAQAVEDKIENSVTESQGRYEQTFGFIDRDDIRQALSLRRLDQVNVLPGLVQHVSVVELKAVKIEFDDVPRMGLQKIGETVSQLLFGQIVDLMIEIGADAANGAGRGFYCLGLQTPALSRWALKILKLKHIYAVICL